MKWRALIRAKKRGRGEPSLSFELDEEDANQERESHKITVHSIFSYSYEKTVSIEGDY